MTTCPDGGSVLTLAALLVPAAVLPAVASWRAFRDPTRLRSAVAALTALLAVAFAAVLTARRAFSLSEDPLPAAASEAWPLASAVAAAAWTLRAVLPWPVLRLLGHGASLAGLAAVLVALAEAGLATACP